MLLQTSQLLGWTHISPSWHFFWHKKVELSQKSPVQVLRTQFDVGFRRSTLYVVSHSRHCKSPSWHLTHSEFLGKLEHTTQVLSFFQVSFGRQVFLQICNVGLHVNPDIQPEQTPPGKIESYEQTEQLSLTVLQLIQDLVGDK